MYFCPNLEQRKDLTDCNLWARVAASFEQTAFKVIAGTGKYKKC